MIKILEFYCYVCVIMCVCEATARCKAKGYRSDEAF